MENRSQCLIQVDVIVGDTISQLHALSLQSICKELEKQLSSLAAGEASPDKAKMIALIETDKSALKKDIANLEDHI